MGCIDRLPEQDLRIRNEIPIAKLSPEALWDDFQKDPAGARARYWGKAIDISGKPTRADGQDSTGAYLLFVQAGELGVRANLLDEDAPAILQRVSAGERITIRCYCEGLDGHVLLKSCMQPQP